MKFGIIYYLGLDREKNKEIRENKSSLFGKSRNLYRFFLIF